MINLENIKIAVIGLGYVGLPVALAFAGTRRVIGFDIDPLRISELRSGEDRTKEVAHQNLIDAKNILFTDNINDLRSCNCYIVTVPTPIDKDKKPDLSALLKATATVGSMLSVGGLVIYESTVYPGCTEEDCVPVLEKHSGLKFNRDFFCGYSPERINPGDKTRSISDIKKITSGSTAAAAELVDKLYGEIVEAGTFQVESIRVAEAAKVIENTQRDLNIALINELAIIFNKMNLDTGSVLEAASTKWNFMPFKPGLVGGHCIGVDPYYLTFKAQQLGHNPEVILAGRRLNDGMGAYVASQLVKAMINKNKTPEKARVLVMGLTFKENCPDIRNTRVIDIINELSEYSCNVYVYDPWASRRDVESEYGISLIEHPDLDFYDAIVIAVAHDCFKELCLSALRSYGKSQAIIYDVKGIYDRCDVDLRL